MSGPTDDLLSALEPELERVIASAVKDAAAALRSGDVAMAEGLMKSADRLIRTFQDARACFGTNTGGEAHAAVRAELIADLEARFAAIAETAHSDKPLEGQG